MSKGVQHFLFGVLVQLLLPLMPVGTEACLQGTVSDQTYAISAAMYTISVGVASKNLAMLGAGILTGMAFSSIFGFVVSGNTLKFPIAWPALITIACFAVVHGIERYARHVKGSELFLDHNTPDV